MSEIYKLSGFQQELDKAERFFSMHLTRQELKSRLDEIERLHSIIKEVRELIKSKWEKDSYWEDTDNCLKFCTFNEYEKEDILKILDKENKDV